MTVAAVCPSCLTGTVAVGVASWPTPLGARRSVWVDEPVSCTWGCRLTHAQVLAVLTGPAARHPCQLPLWARSEAA